MSKARATAQDASRSFTSIRRKLLYWYDRHARDLPWRRRNDEPYVVWLSEMMLQQTQVKTALPYFSRFVARFPTVEALAAAPQDDVLAAWAGLGYYARARNLHAAAKRVVDAHGGRFPDTVEGLLELPGVGRYSAAAIASIVFGRRAAVLDGNVARVLARLFALDVDVKSEAGKRELWSRAQALLPRTRCGDFNQAVMELGATVCTPRSPTCLLCPLSENCAALHTGRVNELPRTSKRTARKLLRLYSVAIVCGDRVLLRRRPAKGLWGGLWELPTVERNGAGGARAALADALPPSVFKHVGPMRAIGLVSRELTHRTAEFELYRGRFRGNGGRLAANFRWVALEDAPDAGVSSVQRKLIGMVRGG